MTTPITISNKEKSEYVKMSKMKPYDVAVIKTPGSYYGEVVMRTASLNKFEVMNLSNPEDDSCWDIEAANIHEVLIMENAEINVKF